MEAKSQSTGKWLIIGCVVIVGIIVVACLAAVIAFFVWAATTPEGGVRLSNQLDSYALEYIKEHELVHESEEIIAYYDATLSYDSTEAAILTTERVIYHKEGRTTSIELKNIDNVDHHYESLSGDVIEVKDKSGMRLRIEIAPFNGGETFYTALMDAWNLVQ
jgi:hypothetical protein